MYLVKIKLDLTVNIFLTYKRNDTIVVENMETSEKEKKTTFQMTLI